jgi:hypothetical protein
MGNVCCARLLRIFRPQDLHLSLQTSTTSGKAPVRSVKSQTVTVEMEGVLLLPFGSRRALVGLPAVADEAPAPLAEDPALELDTDPMVFAVPIGALCCAKAGRVNPACNATSSENSPGPPAMSLGSAVARPSEKLAFAIDNL